MELNKTVYLDGYVYETTLLFCETLKFSKAADLKKSSMESLMWVLSNRQHLLKPFIHAEVLKHIPYEGQ